MRCGGVRIKRRELDAEESKPTTAMAARLEILNTRSTRFDTGYLRDGVGRTFQSSEHREYVGSSEADSPQRGAPAASLICFATSSRASSPKASRSIPIGLARQVRKMEGAAKFASRARIGTRGSPVSKPVPHIERTRLSDDGGATTINIAVQPDPTGVTNPAQMGWFTDSSDP
jgi:hypothetical protein